MGVLSHHCRPWCILKLLTSLFHRCHKDFISYGTSGNTCGKVLNAGTKTTVISHNLHNGLSSFKTSDTPLNYCSSNWFTVFTVGHWSIRDQINWSRAVQHTNHGSQLYSIAMLTMLLKYYTVQEYIEYKGAQKREKYAYRWTWEITTYNKCWPTFMVAFK